MDFSYESRKFIIADQSLVCLFLLTHLLSTWKTSIQQRTSNAQIFFPPSSPIISRTKRVEVQKKEDSFDEDAQELTISKEETEINRTEHNTNIQSGVKFFSLTSFFVEERREKYLSIGCPLLDRSLSGR